MDVLNTMFCDPKDPVSGTLKTKTDDAQKSLLDLIHENFLVTHFEIVTRNSHFSTSIVRDPVIKLYELSFIPSSK